MSKPTKRDLDRDRWVEETRMFQRIAGRTEDSREELAAEWDKLMARKPRRAKKSMADNAEIQRVILQQAGEAGRQRKN